MQSSIEEHLEKIEKKLVSRYPKRERFLRAAFASHRRQDYASAILLFLAQADGICCDFTGAQLYSRKKPLAPKLPKIDPESVMAMLIVALVETLPLTAPADERRKRPGLLNRHSAVHGESLDYDSQLNSCRAISWIAYVGWILHRLSAERTTSEAL